MTGLRQREHYRRHPAVFEVRRSRGLTLFWGFQVLAAGLAVLVVLVNYQAIDEVMRQNPSGRWSRAGAATPLLLTIVWTGIAIGVLIAGTVRVTHRPTGAPVRIGFTLSLGDSPLAAHELHRRFSTGDPRVYQPLPPRGSGSHADLEIGWVREHRLAWIAITRRDPDSARRLEALPLIELTGAAADALAAALRHDLERPAHPEAVAILTGTWRPPPGYADRHG